MKGKARIAHDRAMLMNSAPERRLVPDKPLPPYTYVPGQSPHPVSDPRGHSFGVLPDRPNPAVEDQWQECQSYLYGIDLFNHGYYWEAHEAWEGLWHACGRRSRMATFLKGLIKLAAAGVKARQGNRVGVRTHAGRAAEHFQQTVSGAADSHYMGLGLKALICFAADLSNRAREATTASRRSPSTCCFDRVTPVDCLRRPWLPTGRGGNMVS